MTNAALISFEDFKQENGKAFWWATDLMKMLEYKSMSSFEEVIRKAQKTCLTLKIDTNDSFIQESKEIDGKRTKNYKLSRFACYLVVMNGDTKKKAVARAQVYFAELTRRFEIELEHANELERVQIRDELKEGQKILHSRAYHAGVTDFAKFQNAGYRGMYNMFNVELARKRNVEPGKLFEIMGRTELAANLFRVTQTEERIKYQKIQGQKEAESTHEAVGREVREMVKKNTGKAPEQLPIEDKISGIASQIKKVNRTFIKQDTK